MTYEFRTCKTCEIQKPINEFRNHFVKGKWYREHECKRCGADKALQWYRKNHDRARKARGERYAKNAPALRKSGRDRYHAIKAVDPTRHRDQAREWRKKNKISDASAAKRWRAKNPEHARMLSKKRRAKLQSVHVEWISPKDVEEIAARQNFKCIACPADLTKRHIDHRMPLALGGRHEKKNIDLLCPSCNLSKSAKHPIDFMRSRGFLL